MAEADKLFCVGPELLLFMFGFLQFPASLHANGCELWLGTN